MDPQATAGRIVHYYAPDGGGACAAIVNRDTGPAGFAQLTIFGPHGPMVRDASYSEEPAPGCWSWMPYQKAKADTPGGNQSESAEPRPDSGRTPESTPSSEK